MTLARICLVAASLVVCGQAPTVAVAGCVEIDVRPMSGQRVSVGTNRTFALNEPMTICVTLQEERLVSIWDTPPDGDAERLYPNVLTPGNDVGANALAAGQHCFGGAETFPLFADPRDGAGEGALWVVASKDMTNQPKLEDYSIPNQRVSRSSVNALSLRSGDSCANDPVDDLVRYRVEKPK